MSQPWAPVEIVNPGGAAPLVIICDHATNAVPPELASLGLGSDALARHIGWDIGAAAVARHLARALGATAVLSSTSRLVIDPNRDPADPTSIPEVSDGIAIPANRAIDSGERERRIARFFQPYHDAIEREIVRLKHVCTAPALFSVHSFTPNMAGEERPWHIGVLWNRDPRMAGPLIRMLRAHPDDLVVGDNKPYSGQEVAYSLNRHGGGNGLPHVAVEIRQDLVADAQAEARWAGILEGALREILKTPGLHRIAYY